VSVRSSRRDEEQRIVIVDLNFDVTRGQTRQSGGDDEFVTLDDGICGDEREKKPIRQSYDATMNDDENDAPTSIGFASSVFAGILSP